MDAMMGVKFVFVSANIAVLTSTVPSEMDICSKASAAFCYLVLAEIEL